MNIEKIDIELLSRLTNVAGAPGYEDRIREQIQKEIKDYVDEMSVDNLGNLIALKKGINSDSSENKKVMVDAHMDEIAFMVTYIDDRGFVYFHPLGGFDPKTLTAQRVIIHGKKDMLGILGTKAIHMMTAEERKKSAELDDYFIDLGLPKSEVEKYISIGDTITRERDLVEIGNTISTKSLDNRIAVYILVETLKNLEATPFDVYAVFSVQEEVGLRGALVATRNIDPDFAICLDTTVTNDMPSVSPQKRVTELGKGTGIKIIDTQTICDPRMVDFLKATADRESITWQPEVLPAGGTNTASLQRGGKGSIAGAISIPTRYLHQVTEMVHKDDVLASIRLLMAALETMDKYNWDR